MSVRASTGSPRTCSGARYFAVPTIRPGWVRSASASALAMPKSATLTRPSPHEQHVGRLHVAVHETGPVRGVEGLGHLRGHAGGLPRVDRGRLVEALPQGVARARAP